MADDTMVRTIGARSTGRVANSAPAPSSSLVVTPCLVKKSAAETSARKKSKKSVTFAVSTRFDTGLYMTESYPIPHHFPLVSRTSTTVPNRELLASSPHTKALGLIAQPASNGDPTPATTLPRRDQSYAGHRRTPSMFSILETIRE